MVVVIRGGCGIGEPRGGVFVFVPHARGEVHEAGHIDRSASVQGNQLPGAWIGVLAIQDGLEVQVASGGPAGGADGRDNLAGTHALALLNGDPLKVVVGGDESVPVVDLHPVATTPGVPTRSANHTGVGREDAGPAGSCEVLARVEFTGFTGNGAGPHAERRTGGEELQR